MMNLKRLSSKHIERTKCPSCLQMKNFPNKATCFDCYINYHDRMSKPEIMENTKPGYTDTESIWFGEDDTWHGYP